jgi:hypothetical protein
MVTWAKTDLSHAAERKPMDSDMAYKLVSDWAQDENEDTSGMESQANGDFRGDAASLAFQFEGATHTLMVRGRVLSGLAEARKFPDALQELDRIAREEPERVSQAKFDLAKMPWDPDEEPALYLRRDYKEACPLSNRFMRKLSSFRSHPNEETKLFEEWRKLRKMAYLWHRIYFRKAIDPIVQRRIEAIERYIHERNIWKEPVKIGFEGTEDQHPNIMVVEVLDGQNKKKIGSLRFDWVKMKVIE